ncbi:MAG: hypothetical protein AAF497_14985, partial [Planctomycetota bacterium]
DVLRCVVTQVSNERNAQATMWRDKGDIEQARKVLLGNAKYLDDYAKTLKSEKLAELSKLNRDQSMKLDSKNWNLNRKAMRGRQYEELSQQTFRGSGEKSKPDKN